jgi:hypothetical protein
VIRGKYVLSINLTLCIMHSVCYEIMILQYPLYCESKFETLLSSGAQCTWHVIVWNDRRSVELRYMHL